MLHEEDTGFEFLLAANEHGHHSSKPDGVGGNDIFRIGAEVVLLAAAQAELTNLREEGAQLLLTEEEIGGSFVAIEQRAGASPIKGKTIGHGLVDTK